MELLLRWRCETCNGKVKPCSSCKDKGYIERWLPAEVMIQLKSVPFLILDRRQ